jgi:hypothetical protein
MGKAAAALGRPQAARALAEDIVRLAQRKS